MDPLQSHEHPWGHWAMLWEPLMDSNSLNEDVLGHKATEPNWVSVLHAKMLAVPGEEVCCSPAQAGVILWLDFPPFLCVGSTAWPPSCFSSSYLVCSSTRLPLGSSHDSPGSLTRDSWHILLCMTLWLNSGNLDTSITTMTLIKRRWWALDRI